VERNHEGLALSYRKERRKAIRKTIRKHKQESRKENGIPLTLEGLYATNQLRWQGRRYENGGFKMVGSGGRGRKEKKQEKATQHK